jgi:hypothetical protein
MRFFFGFDQLSREAQSIAFATNLALDQVIGAQCSGDFGATPTLAELVV